LYLWALLQLWFEGEPFFLVVNVEVDLSGSYIYVSIGNAQESSLED
jgi:hypothetical protein